MAAFRREYGTAIITDPDAPMIEMNTITCCHCQRVVHIGLLDAAGKTDAGGFCRLCMKCTCGPCADEGICIPFEAKLEVAEGRRAFYRGIEVLESI